MGCKGCIAMRFRVRSAPQLHQLAPLMSTKSTLSTDAVSKYRASYKRCDFATDIVSKVTRVRAQTI